MKKLYKRYVFYYLIAIIMGFLFLEVGFAEAFKSYFYVEKKQELLSQAIKISDIYSAANNKYELDEELKIFDKYSDYSFFICNSNLNVIRKSQDIKSEQFEIDLNSKYYNQLQSGQYVMASDDFNGLYNRKRYYIAYPFNYNFSDRIIFVTSSLDKFNNSITKWYIISGIFIIIALIIGFVIIYLSNTKTWYGITKLNDAAKRISAGNFNQRIESSEKDEFFPIAQSFNEMAESLSQTEKNEQEFLTNIAHDIRSPITSINGFINALLDGTIPKEKTDHYLNIIKSETERLSKLTNSILDFSNMSEKKIELNKTKFNINDLIFKTVESVGSRIYSKNIDIEYDFPKENLFVFADYDKIQRVLYNIYDNAIKFTDESGTITTSIKTESDKAIISISNTGKGLTKEECKRVFDRLYKTDSSRGIDKTGSGLGLSIVKSFINAHNETIEVTSLPNQITTFTFTLSIAE